MDNRIILREMGLGQAVVRPPWPRVRYGPYRELLAERLSELGAGDALPDPAEGGRPGPAGDRRASDHRG